MKMFAVLLGIAAIMGTGLYMLHLSGYWHPFWGTVWKDITRWFK